jgi:hypothetical protein
MSSKVDLRLRIRENEIAPARQGAYRRAAWLLFWLAPGLRLFSLRRCYHGLRLLSWFPRRKTAPLEPIQYARQIGNIVRVAARRCIFQADCLEQSLALWYLLKRAGIESQLRLGSRFYGNQFEAHAWVEVQEQIVSEKLDPRLRYVAFDWSLTNSKTKQGAAPS